MDEHMVLVPQSALDWLFGVAPDANGKWFGDDFGQQQGERIPAFWWRSKFREMINYTPTDNILPEHHQQTDCYGRKVKWNFW